MADEAIVFHRRGLSRLQAGCFWLLLLWSLAMMVPDITRLTADFYSFRFSLDNDGRVYQVEDAPHGETLPVKRGDRIDLTKTSTTSLMWFLAGEGGVQIQSSHLKLPLVILGTDGRQTTIEVQNYPIGALSWQQKMAILVEWIEGIAFLFLASFLLWRRPEAMTWGLFLYSLWFNPGPYEVFYSWIAAYPLLTYAQELIQANAQAVGYGGFLIFALYFPDGEISARGRRFRKSIPAIVAVVAVLQVLGFFNTLGWRTEGVVRASYFCAWIIDLLVLYILLEKSKWQAPEVRQRTRWVIWGGWLGLVGYILADSYNSTSIWDFVDIDGFLRARRVDPDLALAALYSLNMVFGGTIFYSVLRHRVKDVSFFISRTTAIGIVGLAVGMLVEYLIHFTDEQLGDMRVGGPIQFGVVFLVSIFLKPLHEWLKEYCDRRIYPGLHHLVESLKDFEKRLPSIAGFAELAEFVADRPMDALRLSSSAVLVDVSTRGNFPDRHYAGEWRPEIADPKVDPRALEGCFVDDREETPTAVVAPVQDVLALTPPVRLSIPVKINGHLRGVVLYGGHASGAAFLAEEIELLTKYVDASARGLAQLYIKRLESDLAARDDGEVDGRASARDDEGAAASRGE